MELEPGVLAVKNYPCPACGSIKGEVCVKLSNFVVPAERTHMQRIKLTYNARPLMVK